MTSVLAIFCVAAGIVVPQAVLDQPLPRSTEEDLSFAIRMAEFARCSFMKACDGTDKPGLRAVAACLRGTGEVRDEATAAMVVGASPAYGLMSIAREAGRMVHAAGAAARARSAALVAELVGAST